MLTPKLNTVGYSLLFTLVVFLLAIPPCLFAQSAPKTDHFSTVDGLSHRWILDIMQDSRGFLWISTFDGLNRYDGNTFKVFRPSIDAAFSLGADRIRWAEEQPDGRFLVSTEEGLLRFDPFAETFQIVKNNEFSRDVLFFSTAKEPAGIWRQEGFNQAAGSSLLDIYKEEDGKLQQLESITKPEDSAFELIHASKNEFWFWTWSGKYYRLSLPDKQWTHFDIPDLVNKNLPLDHQGKCWYIKPGDDQLHFFKLPDDIPVNNWSSINYSWPYIWLLHKGAQQGIYRLNTETDALEEIISAPDFGIDERHDGSFATTLLEDREGIIWIGHFQGIIKVQRSQKLFTRYLDQPFLGGRYPPVGFSARTMVEDKSGNILVRENSGDLFKINPTTGTTEKISLKPSQGSMKPMGGKVEVNQLMIDKEGICWITTANHGVLKYDLATGTCLSYSNSNSMDFVGNIFQDNQGRIWIGIDQQVYQFDPTSGDFHLLEGIKGNISFAMVDPVKPIIWNPSEKGITKINIEEKTIEEIQLYTEPRDQRQILLYQGYFWLATSRGLVKADPVTFVNKTYSRVNGLPGDFVYSLLADGDYLWLGTSDGLCRFNIKTEAVKNFYVEDGLSHYEFNSNSTLRASNGRLYMGTLNGVNAFFSKNLTGEKVIKPHILWSDFSYFDVNQDSLISLKFGELDTNRTMVLPPLVKNVTFYLALNSYAEPEKNQYIWRLQGLDDDWNYADQPYVAFNQLPPGRYTFQAKAADPFGNWSDNELIIALNIPSPWYSRWWAWLIYLLVVGSIAYAFYHFQLGRKLAKAENHRLRELDDFKTQFFANITHEFRTPLTVILGTSQELITNSQQWVRQDQRVAAEKKISLIKRSGENLLRLINQILDLAKLESNSIKMNYIQGDVLAYFNYIAESLHSLANTQNVLVRVESQEASLMMDYDPDRLLYIIHNLLSNAIKFTPSGGRVTLQANFLTPSQNAGNGKMLKLEVIDTGVGIPPEDLPKVFDRFYQAKNQQQILTGGSGIGLALTKELVKAMEGEIFVESQPGKRTTFTVLLPVRNIAPMGEMVKPFLNTSISLDENLAIKGGASNDEKLDAELVEEHSASQSSAFQKHSVASKRPVLLLIEDNPDVVEYLIACLRKNYRLLFAYNGQSGIELGLEQVPDIIISDVMMPEKDGFEVVEALKNDERTSHIPIVLLTAKAEIESRIAGLRRGADVYLSKPFHQEELDVTLEKLLENRHRLQKKYSHFSTPQQDTPLPSEVEKQEDAFMRRLKSFFETKLSFPDLSLEDTCQEMGMGRTNLNRKVQALTNKSAMQILRELRLHKAKELLTTTDMNISEVASEVGFRDPKYFSRVFSEAFGYPPSKVKSKF